MEYLLAWRMAVARDLLRGHDFAIAEVAERVGYGSASTFSTAFSRNKGQPPSRYARADQNVAPSQTSLAIPTWYALRRRSKEGSADVLVNDTDSGLCA
jgi:AraC-like DNA-binding protein